MSVFYPTLPYMIGSDPQPLSAAQVDVAPNGRAYVQDLTVYDDARLEIRHELMTRTQVEDLLRFWSDNRWNTFLYSRNDTTYTASFAGKPRAKHRIGPWWDADVELIIRQEDSQ